MTVQKKKEKRRLKRLAGMVNRSVLQLVRLQARGAGAENGNEDPQEWPREFPKRSRNEDPYFVVSKSQLTAAESLKLPRQVGKKRRVLVEVGDGSGDSNRKAGEDDGGLDEPTDENDEQGRFFKQTAHTKVRASNSVLKVK